MIVAMNALRDGPEADPPLGMKRALIFQGALAMSVSLLIFGLRGEQSRRRADESALRAQEANREEAA